MSDDILKRVQDAEGRLQDLYGRMDNDADLAKLSDYELQSTDGRSIPNVVSVTMNEPAVFVNAVVAMLEDSVWQTTIDGDGLDDKTPHRVERFVDACLSQADDILTRAGGARLYPFLCNHICLRGWVGVRWVTNTVSGRYMPDVLPLDMRYFSYERGRDGLYWGAYRTTRTASRLSYEYPEYGEFDEGDHEVIDFWDNEQNIVFVDNDVVLTQKNIFGAPPFVIQSAPSGFMLQDASYAMDEGESIFSLTRDMYPEFNRLVSIDQTLAMKAVMPAYQREVDDTSEEPADYPDLPGAVTDVKRGEIYQRIPQADINNASRVAHGNISNALQRGGINDIDLGNVTFPTSSVWITEQTEIRNKLVAPRLEALGRFYSNLAYMIIRQYQTGGYTKDTKTGLYGKTLNISASELGDPSEYMVRYRLMSQSKKQEIANVTVAAAARGIISRETIIRDILAFEDPEGEMDRMDSEESEELEPALKLVRMACSLCDIAEDLDDEEADQKRLESMMLTEKAILLIKQSRLAAANQMPKETSSSGNKQARSPVPLIEGRGAEPLPQDNGANFGRASGGRRAENPKFTEAKKSGN